MKKLTSEQFLALNFSVVQCDSTEREFKSHITDSNPDGSDIVKYVSSVAGYATLRADDVELEFSWTAQGGTGSYRDAHEFTVELHDDACFELRGAMLVDADGDDLSRSDRDEVFRELLNETSWEQSVKPLLPTPEIEEIDIDTEDTDMETFIVERDSEPSIKFTGEKIGVASSSDERARSDFSGSTGRWTTLRLYRTKGGKLICEQIGHTRWQGEHTRYSGAICETEAEVIKFFGHGWLAKELYDDAGIDASIEVE